MEIGDICIQNGVKVLRKDRTNYYLLLPCRNCGKLRWVNKNTVKRSNYKGQCKKCAGNHAKPPRYEGRYVDGEGYIWVQLKPDNPFYSMVDTRGYVREHKLVMAQNLGRCLSSSEMVHHKNNIRNDNRINNLELQNQSDHMRNHMKIRYANFTERNKLIREYHKSHPHISGRTKALLFKMSYSNFYRIAHS